MRSQIVLGMALVSPMVIQFVTAGPFIAELVVAVVAIVVLTATAATAVGCAAADYGDNPSTNKMCTPDRKRSLSLEEMAELENDARRWLNVDQRDVKRDASPIPGVPQFVFDQCTSEINAAGGVIHVTGPLENNG